MCPVLPCQYICEPCQRSDLVQRLKMGHKVTYHVRSSHLIDPNERERNVHVSLIYAAVKG
jgi:hypothetical protein